jgi:hypothetical protein
VSFNGRSHADVDANDTGETRIDLRRRGGRLIVIGDDDRGRVRLAAALAVLPGKGLVAQRELQAIIGRFRAGLLERALELRLVSLAAQLSCGSESVSGRSEGATEGEIPTFGAVLDTANPFTAQSGVRLCCNPRATRLAK